MKTYASNLWYHSSSRANLINIVVGTAAVVIATYLIYSIFTSLFDFGFLTGPYASPDRSGIFSFLHVEASDPRWLGMLKGAGNTISVVIFAIALASLLGLLVGVARLSTNPILKSAGQDIRRDLQESASPVAHVLLCLWRVPVPAPDRITCRH